ncbi:MAG: cob(I)yrinic acid a,c-diamide adenosyltransferase [Oligoflexales bacterium]
MRLDKIYTKVGDKGSTLLATGQRVPKSSLRIDAYGTVDELNAQLGMLRDGANQEMQAYPSLNAIYDQIYLIQNELFDIGAELASLSSDQTTNPCHISMKNIERLEQEMDHANEHLSPLQNFVLPGGHSLNSQAHICRCICRRAERRVISLHEDEPIRSELRVYLNRLSDWIFIMSRYICKELSVSEVLWQQKR